MSILRRRPSAVLPEALEEETVADMNVGDVRFVVPWCMWVDAHRKCWLNPTHTAHAIPGGTVAMRVERLTDGYRVWTVPEYKYKPSPHPHDGTPGGGFLPVVDLVD